MLRHKGFKSAETFRNFMQSLAPSDVYYSGAYYENPEEEMAAKIWLGADLIFDIDADHIPTSCDKQHDIWSCKNCGKSGHGARPKKCPNCEGEKFEALVWPCDICLESAKQETMKLLELLCQDLGFSEREIILAFSGHRGYHVHIENEATRVLDAMSRKEIVDYLLGIGLELRFHGFDLKNGVGANLEDVGWKGRIAKGVYEILLSAEHLEQAGFSKKIAAQIVQQRDKILKSWKTKGPWKILKGVGPDSWQKIIQKAVEKQSVKIDTVVTTDIHRLIRLANTLHGETGLLKVEVPVNEIEGFDPFKSAIAFKQGEVTVDISEAPEFRLGDKTYRAYKNERVELPTAAAMLLLCKGAAKMMEEKTVVQ